MNASTVSLTYLTVRCADIERTRAFYECLGLQFVMEKHGRGPRHYAATLGGLVLELYPPSRLAGATSNMSGSATLCFQVPSLATAKKNLDAAGFNPSDYYVSDHGSQALRLDDPDGRRVHLTQ